MPLIEISSLRPPFGVEPGTVAREVNLAVAAALHCPLSRVTTTWRLISGPYAVGAAVSDTARRDSHGPIVHIYLDDELADHFDRASLAVTRVLTRALAVAPSNVVVTTHREATRAPAAAARRPRHNGHAAAAR